MFYMSHVFAGLSKKCVCLQVVVCTHSITSMFYCAANPSLVFGFSVISCLPTESDVYANVKSGTDRKPEKVVQTASGEPDVNQQFYLAPIFSNAFCVNTRLTQKCILF